MTRTILTTREPITAIGERRRHLCDIDDDWRSVATAMAATESTKTGRPVPVEHV